MQTEMTKIEEKYKNNAKTIGESQHSEFMKEREIQESGVRANEIMSDIMKQYFDNSSGRGSPLIFAEPKKQNQNFNNQSIQSPWNGKTEKSSANILVDGEQNKFQDQIDFN
jgi:hypothetical protein